jgi:GNAT superfamily N-acetyltransferase
MENKYSVRRANWEDVEEIVEMSFEGKPEPSIQEALPDFEPEGYLVAFQRINNDPNCFLMVVDCNSVVIGTFQLTYLTFISGRGKEDCQIESVFVAKDWRAKGVGTFMMKWAIDHARSRDCRRIQLTSNKLRTRAHNFYRNLGFKFSHEGAKLDLIAGK